MTTTTSSLPGYSVALLHKACGISYVAGAPRYKQRGAVFELQKEGKETNFVPVLEGEQVHEKDAPIIIDGGPGSARGNGAGFKAHQGLSPQPGQSSGRKQCHCPSSVCLISPGFLPREYGHSPTLLGFSSEQIDVE